MKPILKLTARVSIAAASIAAGLGIQLATPAFAAVTAPPWEPDANAVGNLLFYDSSGNLLTSGTNLNHLFDYAAATSAGDSGAIKATLYFAVPNHSLPTTSWAKKQESGSYAYPNSAAPAPLTGPGFTYPLVSLKSTDANLNDVVSGGAFVLDSTAGYSNLIEVRVIDNLGNTNTKYFESDIAFNTTSSATTVDGVNVPANGWALVYPAPAATTTTVNQPTSSAVVGQPSTFTASVSPNPSGGTVSFSDNGAPISGCQNVTVSAAAASCTTTFTTAGSHPITAQFNGNATGGSVYTASTSASTAITVGKGATTTTLSPTTSSSVGQMVTYTATVSPAPGGGTVAFTDGTGNPATSNCAAQPVNTSTGVATCTVQYNSASTYTVAASFNGSTNYTGSTAGSVQQTVAKANTAMTLATSGSPKGTGQSVTYTATISPVPDGGSVAFTDGTGNPATTGCSAQPVNTTTGVASCQVTYSTQGSYSVSASYAGDTNYNATTAGPLSETINTPTSISISSSGSSVVGDSVKYTATVTPTPDGGTVAFNDGAGNPATASCASVPVDTATGTAACTVTYTSPGSFTVNASYSGDALFGSSSTSTAVNQSVGKATTSTGSVAATPTTSNFGQSVSYSATVTVQSGAGVPTGSVQFTTNGGSTVLCTAALKSSGSASCPSTSTPVGSDMVTAVYGGDPNFTGSSSTAFPVTVNPATTSTAVSAAPNPALTNHSVTYTARVAVTSGSATPAGTVSFDDSVAGPISGCTAVAVSSGKAVCATSYATAGQHSITAVFTSNSGNVSGSSSQAYSEQINAPTAPTAPANLKAAAGDGKVALSWAPPSSNGGSAISGYNIFEGSSAGAETATPINSSPVTADSYTVSGLSNNTTYYFTVKAVNAVGSSTASNEASATPKRTAGYVLVGRDGGVFAFGVPFKGSLGNVKLAAPIVGAAETPDKNGYWVVAKDGGVFAFGDAGFYGSLGKVHLAAPIATIVATPTGKGYWLIGTDGGVFNFGDAGFHGSLGAIHLNGPIVAAAATSDGAGYWLVGSDGGIFNFGDAGYHGSLGNLHLNAPIVGIAPSGDNGGYTLVGSDGGVFGLGDAGFYGSLGGVHLVQPVVGVVPTSDGKGYTLVAADGGAFCFGDSTFVGSLGGTGVNDIVAAG